MKADIDDSEIEFFIDNTPSCNKKAVKDLPDNAFNQNCSRKRNSDGMKVSNGDISLEKTFNCQTNSSRVSGKKFTPTQIVYNLNDNSNHEPELSLKFKSYDNVTSPDSVVYKSSHDLTIDHEAMAKELSDKILREQADDTKDTETGKTPRRRFQFRKSVNKRYHENEGCESTMKPGVMSSALREALGLGANHLPMHIYQMRRLGYPPGWLRDMELEQNTLSFVNNEVDDANCTLNRNLLVQYNTDKIISYAGFNVPAGRNVIDYCKRLGAPAMQRQQGIAHFKQFLLSVNADNKKRDARKANIIAADLKFSTSNTKKDDNVMTAQSSNNGVVQKESNLSAVIGWKNAPGWEDTQVVNGDVAITMKIEDEVDDDDENKDDNLAELELQRRFLLSQLDLTACSDLSVMDSSESDDFATVNNSVTTSSPERDDNSCNMIATDDMDKSFKNSLQQTLGSPVFGDYHLQDVVPTCDKFSHGIGDYLPYENLPGVTGVFEKVFGKLKSMRDRLRKSSC